MKILAVIETPSDLRAACKARRSALGLRHLDVDEIAGLQTGYYGRLELGTKGFGEMSLGAVLGALKCRLVMVPCATSAHDANSRDETAEPLKEKLRKRTEKRARTMKIRWTAADRAKWARKAAKARWRADPGNAGRKGLARRRAKRRHKRETDVHDVPA